MYSCRKLVKNLKKIKTVNLSLPDVECQGNQIHEGLYSGRSQRENGPVHEVLVVRSEELHT